MEGGHPDRSRATSEEIQPPLALLAEFKVSGDTQFSSPVTVDHELLLVEGDRKLHALKMSTGAQRWEIPLAGSYLSPAIADGKVYVRVESGEDGYIVALDSTSGVKLWEYKFPQVGSDQGNIGGHATSPLVVDGKVLVGAGKIFSALDGNTGKSIWNFALKEPVVSSPALADQTIYIADYQQLYALDLATGLEKWHFQHATKTQFFAPIVMDDKVFLSDGNTAYALQRSDGNVLWQRMLGEKPLIPAGASGDRVYMKSATQLFALNVATGEPLWSYRTVNYVSLPALTQEFIFVITRMAEGSQLRVLQGSDGAEVWKSDNLALTNGAPVAAGGLIFVRTIDGSVLGYQSQYTITQ